MTKKYSKQELKSKLNNKLYLARETPEPIFDLSDCGLKNVPQGVYSLCRVFLKQALFLNNNRLNDLKGGGSLSDLKHLIVLDLQYNELRQLPDEIKTLINLRELYINDNQLKRLPETVTLLSNLQILDVANNSLQKLPDTLGNLSSLQKLVITGNKCLNELPKSLCGLYNLKELRLDGVNFTYPSSTVCCKKLEDIMNYISEDCGIPFVHSIDDIQIQPAMINPRSSNYDSELQKFQEKINEIEKLKEIKQKELLEFEKRNELMHQKEVQLHASKFESKQQLLDDLVKNQAKLENDLSRIQQNRENDRRQLILELQEEERNTESSIRKLLDMNSAPQLQLLQHEAEEEARLYKKLNNIDFKKKEVLEGMKHIFEEESKRFKLYNENKENILKSVIMQEVEQNTHLNDIIKLHDLKQINLLNQLQQDNELQKIVVGVLLERTDARSWGLVQQVNLVTQQLAKVTALELDKKRLQINEQLNDLAENRINLSTILLDLLSKQAERRNQLLATLQGLENIEGKHEDFWLLQYQRLMNRKPEIVNIAHRNLDPEFLQRLLMAGVIHCLPFLSSLPNTIEALKNLNDDQLINFGISQEKERQIILEVVHYYIAQRFEEEECKEPSAPSISQLPTSPPETEMAYFTTVECVICLDSSCAVIFIPCGHTCTCYACSDTVTICPLCRGTIDQKIQMAN